MCEHCYGAYANCPVCSPDDDEDEENENDYPDEDADMDRYYERKYNR